MPRAAEAPAQPAGPNRLLDVSGLSARYGAIHALSAVDLSVDEGQLCLVLGQNGAGKTTLVRAIVGALRASGGRVRLSGRDVSWLPAHRRVRTGLVLVPEGRGVLPGMSVSDNLELGAAAAPRGRQQEVAATRKRVLALFPVLGRRLGQDSGTLSGGEMQMLAIARALLALPRVLLLDEPSLGLAPQMVATVYDALRVLSEDGLAMVLVEQKAVPLHRAPDSTLVLQRGRVAHRGIDEVLTEDQLAGFYLGRVEVA